MKAGRNPTWNAVADLDPSAWLEPVEVASAGRLLLPSAARRRLVWKTSSNTIQLLAYLNVEGGVELWPMTPAGETELQRVSKALGEAGRARGDMVLNAMGRYALVSLTPDGRLRLPASLRVQLGVFRGGVVWVATYEGQLWLWSQNAWAARQGRIGPILEKAVEEVASR
jgi:DNA-binding transcriptional regulator/RsmH inhibitor MraZ